VSVSAASESAVYASLPRWRLPMSGSPRRRFGFAQDPAGTVEGARRCSRIRARLKKRSVLAIPATDIAGRAWEQGVRFA
jgi:hypothetical protein